MVFLSKYISIGLTRYQITACVRMFSSSLSVSSTSLQVGADEPVHYRFDNLVTEIQASITQSRLVRGVVLTAYPYQNVDIYTMHLTLYNYRSIPGLRRLKLV